MIVLQCTLQGVVITAAQAVLNISPERSPKGMITGLRSHASVQSQQNNNRAPPPESR